MVAKRRKSKEVDVADIKKCYSLFLDEKRSVSYLNDAKNDGEFIGDDGKMGGFSGVFPHHHLTSLPGDPHQAAAPAFHSHTAPPDTHSVPGTTQVPEGLMDTT
jgi:RuvB-like protein 2